MANPQSDQDLVSLESAEENKGDVETNNENTDVQEESVFNLTERANRKRKRRSKRKTQASDATETETVPKNNDLPKPTSDIPEEATIATGLKPIRALDYICHKDKYMEKGDVVSITDTKGVKHYALIRKILMYQNSEKGILMNWLLPDCENLDRKKYFDPSKYKIGPEEDLPINIEYLRLIMNLPVVYYSNTDEAMSRLFDEFSLEYSEL